MDHPARVGKYQIEKFLGGAMARVYRAKDTVLGRQVALKILTESSAADGEAKARFFMEARVASSINHENIISVYDFGEDQGRPFMVMEYLEGESLRSALRAGTAGDFARRMRIALQIGRALDHIHARKIIHRDVKPENVHVDPSGKVKMMDFGIAKPEGMQLTQAGFTLGTPYYMAPEQVLGEHLSVQTDVYAFGLVLYELLAGTRAVHGDKVDVIFEAILYTPIDFEPLRTARVPPQIIALIERCAAKRPADRPARLGPVCDEIERLSGWSRHAGDAEIPNMVARPMVEVQAPTKTYLIHTLAGLPAWIGKLPRSFQRPGALMILAGAAVVAAVTVIYIALSLAHVI